MDEKILLEKLDNWINECKNISESFDKSGFEIASMCSSSMMHAYLNVKKFIEEKNKLP